MKNNEIVKIEKRDLRRLLFWAIAGFTNSNGTSSEISDNRNARMIAHFVKVIDMRKKDFPPMGVESNFSLTGETKRELLKELRIILPNRKF